MPEPKAQLIDPQGPIDVPGLQVTGVTTATGGFVGQVQGTATGFAATTYNLNVGIVTGTKFQGNTTGNVSGLADDTNINVGIITSTSFTGDLVGNAAGLSTTTANINAGIISATSFAGNFTGVASGITGTPNIVVGIMTGTLKGDGSNLTGAGSTAYIRQTVGNASTIDLNNGNIVKLLHINDATVSFANTSTADDVTIIRPLDLASEAFTSGAVAFDGTDDRLTLASSSDLAMGTDDFTIEMWVTKDNDGPDGTYQISATTGGLDTTIGGPGLAYHNNDGNKGWQLLAAGGHTDVTYPITTGVWYHIAHVRTGGSSKLYVNGDLILTKSDTTDYSTSNLCIGGYYDTSYLWNGKISNFRVVKGTALYTSNFTPNFAALTNVTNTKLLCCQDTSSTTVGAVKPGTITAVGDPTASSNSIYPGVSSTLTWPSSITWNGGSPPTLLAANSYSLTGQVFNLVTADGGSTWYGYEEVNNTLLQPSKVFVWGQNDDGQIAQNNTTEYTSPVQAPGTTWEEVKTPVCGNDFVLMRKNDGAIWGWGNNEYGMLGQSDQTRRSSPVQLPGTTWALTAAGDQVAAVTNTSGELFTMGYNGWGNLGHNDVANYSSPKQIPGTTWPTSSEGEGRTPIKVGYSNEVVKTDGTLWCWGFNDRGQLGQNNRTNYSSPIQVGSDTTWSCVGGGYEASFGIKTDGTLWAWGTGGHGQLGVNNLAKYSSPVQIPGSTWKSISQGSASSDRIMAIKTDGTLWAWGSNTKGELAQNNYDAGRSSPTQIPGTTWKMASLGDNHAIALKTDGTLWAWGNNQQGKLGQGNKTSYSSPVQIPGTWTSTDAGYRWSLATQST